MINQWEIRNVTVLRERWRLQLPLRGIVLEWLEMAKAWTILYILLLWCAPQYVSDYRAHQVNFWSQLKIWSMGKKSNFMEKLSDKWQKSFGFIRIIQRLEMCYILYAQYVSTYGIGLRVSVYWCYNQWGNKNVMEYLIKNGRKIFTLE